MTWRSAVQYKRIQRLQLVADLGLLLNLTNFIIVALANSDFVVYFLLVDQRFSSLQLISASASCY